MAAGVAGDRTQPLAQIRRALVLHERPRPVERSGAEVIRIPGDDIAGAVADAAADALYSEIHRRPVGRRWLDGGKVILPRTAAFELTLGVYRELRSYSPSPGR